MSRQLFEKFYMIPSLSSTLAYSFVFTTPGVWQPEHGIPFLSPMPGQFLAKDVLFLAAAVWTAGEAMRPRSSERRYAREREKVKM